MVIQDFTDMVKFEQIISNWAKATGLATVAVGADGKYISKCYNFTDFCINLTRGCKEGKARCEKCDREGKGVYHCHAGLIDFGIDLEVNGQKMGSVIGGQVLPYAPNKEKFREVARELGINEEVYLAALEKVPVRSEEVINASAQLLGEVMNDFINSEYNAKYNVKLLKNMTEGVKQCEELVEKIQQNTSELNNIQRRQNILALNASIEAARAGEMGRGFNVVAKQVGDLSLESRHLNEEIEKNVTRISQIVNGMAVKNENE